ncbi:MAG: hypothetical protein WA021_04075 [Minisyncoccia bacterium]
MIRFALLVCIALGLSPFAYAQSDFGRELILTISPTYPAPGQTVRLSIKTYALDLDRSTVTWFVNEKEVARGVGLMETTIVAGQYGAESRIDVVAVDEEEVSARATAVIRPTEVDLLWEAASYAPPFYTGRVLPGASSPIRAQAIARFTSADGKPVADKDIVYTWYRNDAVTVSGRGKSSVVVPGPTLFGADIFRVVAVSADKTLSGEASTRIPSVDPFTMLYENHPLFGILYHRSIEPGATTLETEQKVTAVPYFAGIVSPSDPRLMYEWSVNGTRIEPNPQEPQTLTVTANDYRGPATINLSLMSSSDALLRALGEWQLVFGSSDTSFLTDLNPFGN